MADRDDTRSFNQIKAYPRGSAQGGRAIQAVKGNLVENEGASGHRTTIRETSEGRAIGRTRDNMPMVEIEKQNCEIGVDHGQVDALTIAPLHPDALKDGNLYATPYVAAHSAIVGDPERPIVDEIEPPDSIKGTPPVDGAVAKCLRSVKQGRVDAESVYAKKVVMQRCPASIFTGRMRLWVQALYGRHDALDLVSLADTLPSATPALKMVVSDYDLWLTTNCGVYLDPATAQHWLIKVNSDNVEFWPLETFEDCIDELRIYLLDPDFPVEDKERVETYILADSAPVLSKQQTVSIPATDGYAMGYGWHFNWSGDRCDIVHNTTVPASGGSQNRSTHYRLTFSRDPAGRWGATRSVVEGPVDWKSLRFGHPIACPSWEEGGLTRIGAHLGPQPFGNAPFYAFYVRDELKVCRYSAATATTQKGATRSPWYYKPGTYITIGTDALAWEQWETWSGVSVALSCGSESVSFISGSKSGWLLERSSPQPDYVENWYSTGTLNSLDSIHLFDGAPTSIATVVVGNYYLGDIEVGNTGAFGALTYATKTLNGPAAYRRSIEVKSFVTMRSGVVSEQYSTAFCGVVPFYDAEAFYFFGTHTTNRTEEVEIREGDVVGFFEIYESPVGSRFSVQHKASDAHPPITSIDTITVAPVTQSVKKLVCGTGVVNNPTFPGVGYFFDPLTEVIPQTYATYASASGNSVIAPSTGVDEGNSASDANIYVGWA